MGLIQKARERVAADHPADQAEGKKAKKAAGTMERQTALISCFTMPSSEGEEKRPAVTSRVKNKRTAKRAR